MGYNVHLKMSLEFNVRNYGNDGKFDCVATAEAVKHAIKGEESGMEDGMLFQHWGPSYTGPPLEYEVWCPDVKVTSVEDTVSVEGVSANATLIDDDYQKSADNWQQLGIGDVWF